MKLRWAGLLVAGLLAAGCATPLPFAKEGVLPPAVVVADATPERRALNERTYDAAVEWVAAHYYDRDLRGVDWAGQAAARREDAVSQPTEAAFYARLSALFELLDDRHTNVTSPTGRARRDDQRRGGVTPGFGLGADRIGDDWIVASVSETGPARAAGIQIGWRIVSVDGESDLTTVHPQLGQEVVMILEDEHGAPHTARLVAEERPAVKLHEAETTPEGVLVLRFDRFDAAAVAWLDAQLETALGETRPRAVILDLRGNSGGLMTALGGVVAMLHGERVGYAREKGRFIDTEFVTRPRERHWDGPVLVLIGPTSGSASELLAAHLQEYDRGLVVGQTSAGSVIASRPIDLPDGGVMSLSLRVVLTPRELRSLEGSGVTPDLVVTPTLADRRAGRDVVLDAAVAAALASD